MTNEISIPRADTCLPELMAFVSGLAASHRGGELDSWEALAARTHAFFTDARMAQVEAVVPGWREMSGYGEGVTLVHTMCAMIGLLNSPEYQRASPAQQAQVEWVLLLHDLAKWVREGERDYAHPFRSAALAGAILPQLGFPVTDAYPAGYEAWAALVRGAVIVRREGEKTLYICDNRWLPEIVDGIARLYGPDTPAALIVQAILLHTSITVLQAWPQVAPLSADEEKRYLTPALLPLLKMMMLADNDGWELFNAETQAAFRAETLAVFARLEAVLET